MKKFDSTTKEEECWICKYFNRRSPIHVHYSTQFHHEKVRNRGEENVNCRHCRKIHPITEENKRLNILITSEIDPITTPTDDPSCHVNIEIELNSPIDRLKETWEILYLSEKRAMDILVIAGSAEIPLLEVEDFMESITSFAKAVKNQNKKNSLIFSELIRPPKYCWFNKDKNIPENFVNHLTKVNKINDFIRTFNSANSNTKSISFASRGTRSNGTKRDSEGNLVYVVHKLSDWNEKREGITLIGRVQTQILNSAYRFFSNVSNQDEEELGTDEYDSTLNVPSKSKTTPCKPASAVCSVSGDVTCLCQQCGSCMLLCNCHKCKRCSLYCRCEESTI